MRSFATCLLLLFAASLHAAEPPKGPLSPEESLKHFVLADPNLQIEIVAAEPEVIDPVAIQFDEHGRLWVVELSDYPNGPEPGKPPMSRIKLLEDKDGDGRYETAHIFADKLLFATGVQPWDGGVIVTLAGEVAYFKDTDGDHKADLRETWFTGFAQANPQLRANHPTFGPDGWIYVANGLRGGDVIAIKKDWPVKLPSPSGRGAGGEGPAAKDSTGLPHDPANPKPVSLTGRDFKFDPLTGRYEAISGNGQFGMTFDAWGNRFVCDNRHPCRHVIFEEDFIKRCPHVAFPAVVHDVIPADDKNRVIPLTSAWTTSNLHAGTFTASCGVTVYTGDWLPEEFRGNVFVCEPTGNLVQRAILEPDGVTFKSRNPYQRSPVAPRQEKPNAPTTNANKLTPNGSSESTARSADLSRSDRATETQEFLASRDDWFRPVDLQNGPDGALYVVDMYRAVIEHPEWVPDELKKRPDTWLGNDKGRIYRIRPKSERPKENVVPLVTKEPVALETVLSHRNGWHRMTFARKWRDGQLNVREFKPKWAHFPTKEGECLILQLAPATIAGTSEPAWANWYSTRGWVKARAARLARFGNWPSDDKSLHIGMSLSHGADPTSRLQAIVEVALLKDQGVNSEVHIEEVALELANDPWLRQAVVGATRDEFAYEMLGVLVRGWDARSDPDNRGDYPEKIDLSGVVEVLQMFGEVVGQRVSADEIDDVLDSLWKTRFMLETDAFRIRVATLLGIGRGLGKRGKTLAKLEPELSAESRNRLKDLFARANASLLTSLKSSNKETLALTSVFLFLRQDVFDDAGPTLKSAFETTSDQTLRHAAFESFASFHNPEVDAWLVERYRSETPAIRRAILAALFASKERQLRLLEAIEQGEIAATELGPVQVNQLTQAKDETLRERAKKILAAAAPASRKEVLDAYQPALSLKGDPKRGRELFVKNCSTCHRVDNVGVNVAPDISDTRTKKPEQLLLDILDPNKAIDANYFAYAVVTKEGKTESGVISSETATSITLKQPEGKVLTLLRTDIDELRNTGLSLMPVGVEKNLDKQAMADLVFWLKNWRYLDGKVPATSLGGK